MISEENNQNEANEPVGGYSQQKPSTFDQVWQMFLETDKQVKETGLQVKETGLQMKETDKKLKETGEYIDKTIQSLNRQYEETRQSLQRLSKIASGLGINIGDASEEHFRNALDQIPQLGGITIEKVDSLRRRYKGLEGQFDIVLFGKEEIIVVEVKHKVHPNDVIRLHDKNIHVFKQLYPEYAHRPVMGGLAGMAFDDTAKVLAVEKGLFVLTPAGQKVKVLNPEGFEPKRF